MSHDNKTKSDQRNSAPFPLEGVVRLYQIIGDAKRGIAPFFPVSRSQWLLGIKQGIYPKGIKMSDRLTVWHAQEIREMVGRLTDSSEVA